MNKIKALNENIMILNNKEDNINKESNTPRTKDTNSLSNSPDNLNKNDSNNKSNTNRKLPCFALFLYEKYGSLHSKKVMNNFVMFKFEKVLLDDNFLELYLKGHKSFEEYKIDPKMKSFWFQRYYYYSKYDEGIQMDEESILQ